MHWSQPRSTCPAKNEERTEAIDRFDPKCITFDCCFLSQQEPDKHHTGIPDDYLLGYGISVTVRMESAKLKKVLLPLD